jgi:chemotaxis protein CheD
VSSPTRILFPHRSDADPYRPSEEIKRFYDPRFAATTVMVLPGRHYVTANPQEMIVTLLGSCVAACIRDPVAGIGGLNHFLLPESDSGQWGEASAAMRYGNHAMETLINDIVKRGGDRRRLEVKVFGGGSIIDCQAKTSIGALNAQFVRTYLRNEGFAILAEHLGGQLPRRIHYFAVTGKVKMLLLRRSHDKDLFSKELDYRRRLPVETEVGDIELFDR